MTKLPGIVVHPASINSGDNSTRAGGGEERLKKETGKGKTKDRETDRRKRGGQRQRE